MSGIHDADALKEALDKYRPLNEEKMAIIAEKLNIEWTYHSNAIEGSTLTLAETTFFLREGLTVEGKPLNDFLAARNHLEAIHYLQECLNRDITEALVKEMHALVLRGVEFIQVGSGPTAVHKRVHPGQYKYDNNHVFLPDGSIHWYCDYLQVPAEMERLIAWYQEHRGELHRGGLHPIELATGFHHRLVAIHPFTDGNGRVARLLTNLILMQNHYPPAVIRNEERRDYYAALRAADDGDFSPFVEFVAEAVARTLRLMLDVVEGRLSLTPDDVRTKIDRLSRTDQELPAGTETIRKAREAGETVNEWVGQVVNQFISPPEAGRRFAVKSSRHGHVITDRRFVEFFRRQGFKLLGFNHYPEFSHGLELSFIDAPLQSWPIWFEVATTAREVLLVRVSMEHHVLSADKHWPPPFIHTPILSPDPKQVEEFILREVAAFVERASTALDRFEQEEQ